MLFFGTVVLRQCSLFSGLWDVGYRYKVFKVNVLTDLALNGLFLSLQESPLRAYIFDKMIRHCII